MNSAAPLPLFRSDPEPRIAKLTLPVPPSANTWWRHVVIKGQVRVLVSKDARKYKDAVAQLGNRLCISSGPVKVSIDWYREQRSGDLDKRIGVLFDALQGVLFTTDAQVVELHARRFEDPIRPRVEVTVEAVDR